MLQTKGLWQQIKTETAKHCVGGEISSGTKQQVPLLSTDNNNVHWAGFSSYVTTLYFLKLFHFYYHPHDHPVITLYI